MVDSTFVSAVIIGTVSLVGIAVNSWIAWSNQSKEWNRQRQWELKRDTVLEVTRIISELDVALLDLAHWYFVLLTDKADVTKAMIEKDKTKNRWNSIMSKFDSAKFQVELIVGESLSTALTEYINEMHSVAKKVEDGDTTIYKSSQAAIKQKVSAIKILASKALNLKTLFQ
jgi:hypothetical protein